LINKKQNCQITEVVLQEEPVSLYLIASIIQMLFRLCIQSLLMPKNKKPALFENEQASIISGKRPALSMSTSLGRRLCALLFRNRWLFSGYTNVYLIILTNKKQEELFKFNYS
jgi:hypothetical protein